MAGYGMLRIVNDTESLVVGAFDWLLDAARTTPDGLAWAGAATEPDEIDPTLYSGGAGIVLALLEGLHHFADDRYADAAVRGARALAAFPVEEVEYCSLYFGLAGMAFTLHAVGDRLGDQASTDAATRLLDVVRQRFDGERWSDMFELLGGNAGIALGALAVGDTDLAVLAVEPYLRTGEPTSTGMTWEDRTGMRARFHHLSHGTLGIAYALAAVGHAASRPDLTAAGLAGTADVVSRNVGGDADFLVPHSDPQHRPDLIERYSFGWCHGPAGDAQLFRLLDQVTGDPQWSELGDRCWHTVTHCGLPRRVRPGFWDNSGRCCGTAGVLALALDRYAEGGGDLDFATALADDLAAHATVDDGRARWSNYEHRATPSDLEPETGWAMGNAGIVRELLRFARITSDGDPAYAVPLPDQPRLSRRG
jgi:hypothetical protein